MCKTLLMQLYKISFGFSDLSMYEPYCTKSDKISKILPNHLHFAQIKTYTNEIYYMCVYVCVWVTCVYSVQTEKNSRTKAEIPRHSGQRTASA